MTIDAIVDALEEGKTIVYSTETCYGLGCDATNTNAVQKIFAIKHRQKDKPLLVIGSSIAMMMEYVEWNRALQTLADRYWPGPLTVVTELKSGASLPAGVVGPGRTLAFRVTSHPLAAALAAGLGKPVVSTSANIFTEKNPYDIDAVLSMFEHAEDQPDIVIDGGALTPNSPSTIVRVLDGRMEILRQGSVVVDR